MLSRLKQNKARLVPLVLGIILLAGAGVTTAVLYFSDDNRAFGGGTSYDDAASASEGTMAVDPILLDPSVLPISEVAAEEINEERPNDLADVPAAPPFVIDRSLRDGEQYAAAERCLAQAIYYEAATESALGQRAVAQVVLNRVRHPAFPATVCGVVFQGSERRTGCQFSFTCDGSLRRTPSTSGIARARQFAAEALSGKIVGEVGYATHYHANYVVPYWASSLAKIDRIGAHIFYNMRGSVGAPRTFSMRHQLFRETSVLGANLAAVLQPEELEDMDETILALPVEDWIDEPTAGENVLQNPNSPPPPPPMQADRAQSVLKADNGSTLLVDEKRPVLREQN